MRLFIAIPLPLFSTASRLPQYFQNMLKKEYINWTKQQNYHLTLLFLGETDERLIPEIIELLDEVAYDFDPFELTIENCGLFGSSYDPKVIWAGAQPAEILTEMHLRIVEVMKNIGYKPDRQNFIPHLTLGRIRRLSDKKQLQKALETKKKGLFYSQNVNEIVLYESKLSPQGPEYIIKGTSTLGC